MASELGHHLLGQADAAAAGPGLGQAERHPAVHLGQDLGHLDDAAQQVHAAATQPGQLPDAQPAVGRDQDQRPVALVDHLGQPRDLGRREEPHFLPLHLRQRQAPAGRLGDHAGVDRGAHHLAEELVRLLDRRRRQAAAAQLGHPRAHVALTDCAQRHRPKPRRHVQAQVGLIASGGRAAQVGGRRPPLGRPVAEQNPAQGRIGPGARSLAPSISVRNRWASALRANTFDRCWRAGSR
jgi:hypothetical protein